MIAVISDVHANLPALEAVLADIDAVGATRVWCLGDTLGYGPFPGECMRLVIGRCEVVLAGNHDLAVRGEVSARQFVGSARAGIELARTALDDECRAALASLKPQRFLEGVELYHASAHDPVWEYVRDADVATRHLNLQRLPLSFIGHSHRQLCFELAQDAPHASGGARGAGDAVDLGGEGGSKRVFNPGSVGQPRDGDWRAAWALVEPGRVTFRRVEYDVSRVAVAVTATGLPPETAQRLEHGM